MIHAASAHTTTVVTNIKTRSDIQPNAIDVRVEKILAIDPTNVFSIDEEHKKHRGGSELRPDVDGWFDLAPGPYEVVMENIVAVGAGEAGWVIPRSTLNRNGLFITSGLYDSGYSGVLAACLHVGPGPARIRKGTRIAQFLLFTSEALGKYEGSYGSAKSHDTRYASSATSIRSEKATAPSRRNGHAASVDAVTPSKQRHPLSSSPSIIQGSKLDGANGDMVALLVAQRRLEAKVTELETKNKALEDANVDLEERFARMEDTVRHGDAVESEGSRSEPLASAEMLEVALARIRKLEAALLVTSPTSLAVEDSQKNDATLAASFESLRKAPLRQNKKIGKKK